MPMDNRTSNNAGQFYWWFGVVEDRDDPLRMGRCRVRIMGYHIDDKENLPTEDLPWAFPIMPANNPSISGTGTSSNGVVNGTWVVGFFADGSDGQHPMFFGTVGAVPGGPYGDPCAPSGANSTSEEPTGTGTFTEPAGNAADIESYLESFLDANGKQLANWGPMAKAAIMAQCHAETGGFKWLAELGSKEYFRRYDPDKRKDAAAQGNTQIGDGYKYRGRGFVHLTWKNNYIKAGQYIKMDLLNNPDLASGKEAAAKIVIWYFNTQRPKIGKNNQWGDILAVTKAVNGGTNGLEHRKAAFERYKKKYGIS
jgi:predicted chitinase